MSDDSYANIDTISSFLIEALIWKLPNNIILSYHKYHKTTWDDTIKNAIYHLWTELDKKQCDSWTEPSECLYLFHTGRKWTQAGTKDFLLKMWHYMGYK
jgi:hypothetical protein